MSMAADGAYAAPWGYQVVPAPSAPAFASAPYAMPRAVTAAGPPGAGLPPGAVPIYLLPAQAGPAPHQSARAARRPEPGMTWPPGALGYYYASAPGFAPPATGGPAPHASPRAQTPPPHRATRAQPSAGRNGMPAAHTLPFAGPPPQHAYTPELYGYAPHYYQVMPQAQHMAPPPGVEWAASMAHPPQHH